MGIVWLKKNLRLPFPDVSAITFGYSPRTKGYSIRDMQSKSNSAAEMWLPRGILGLYHGISALSILYPADARALSLKSTPTR